MRRTARGTRRAASTPPAGPMPPEAVRSRDAAPQCTSDYPGPNAAAPARSRTLLPRWEPRGRAPRSGSADGAVTAGPACSTGSRPRTTARMRHRRGLAWPGRWITQQPVFIMTAVMSAGGLPRTTAGIILQRFSDNRQAYWAWTSWDWARAGGLGQHAVPRQSAAADREGCPPVPGRAIGQAIETWQALRRRRATR